VKQIRLFLIDSPGVICLAADVAIRDLTHWLAEDIGDYFVWIC